MNDPVTSTTPTTRSIVYIDLNDTKDNSEDDRNKIMNEQNQKESLSRVTTTSVLQTSPSLPLSNSQNTTNNPIRPLLSNEENMKLEELLKSVRQGRQTPTDVINALSALFGPSRAREISPYLTTLLNQQRGETSKQTDSTTLTHLIKNVTPPPQSSSFNSSYVTATPSNTFSSAAMMKSNLPHTILSVSSSMTQPGLPPAKRMKINDKEMGVGSSNSNNGGTSEDNITSSTTTTGTTSVKQLLDVTHLAGVDLNEEANSILAPLSSSNVSVPPSISLSTSTIPKDFDSGILQKLPIQRKMEQLCAKYKLSLGPRTAELMSHALAERLRALLVQAIIVAKQRLDQYRMSSGYNYVPSAIPRRYFVVLEKRDKEARDRQLLREQQRVDGVPSTTSTTTTATTSTSTLPSSAILLSTETAPTVPGVVPPLTSRELTLLVALHNKQKNAAPGLPQGGLTPQEFLMYQKLVQQHQTANNRIAKKDILFLCERDPHLRRSRLLLSACLGLNK